MNEVALAAIALAATAVGCLVYVIRWFADKFTSALQEHTKAAVKQAQASDEVLKFMKNLNGKFEKAYVDKMKEVTKKGK